MCKCASFIQTKDRDYFSEKSDSHSEIIQEFKLYDGAHHPTIVPCEITPPVGNLSLPLDQWIYNVDSNVTEDQLPDWYKANPEFYQKRCRSALADWAKAKLTAWNVIEAFSPVNPLKLKPKRLTKKLKKSLKKWDSVRALVRASVCYSVGASVGDAVCDYVGGFVGASVRSSVRNSVCNSICDYVCDDVGYNYTRGHTAGDFICASVRDSVGAYTGGLFIPRVSTWKYAEKFGANPWKPLQELWYAGYVPSFDGKIWRLHCGSKARVAFKITLEDLKKLK